MKAKPKEYSSKPESMDDKIVSEPAYAMSGNYGFGNMVILAGAANITEHRITSFEKINIVRKGISKRDLELLKEKTCFDYTTLAKILGVTRATLINKKRSEKFGAVLSEKILSLADLYSYGFEVFGEEERFNKWMGKPNKAIGGEIPYNIIDNQYGREEVKNIIGRIAYGVYS